MPTPFFALSAGIETLHRRRLRPSEILLLALLLPAAAASAADPASLLLGGGEFVDSGEGVVLALDAGGGARKLGRVGFGD
jgi:hypothetical protein